MQRFLARQPIFKFARVVYGYELLFRSRPEFATR
jgi:c-di-GMP-related signal transduction protein